MKYTQLYTLIYLTNWQRVGCSFPHSPIIVIPQTLAPIFLDTLIRATVTNEMRSRARVRNLLWRVGEGRHLVD